MIHQSGPRPIRLMQTAAAMLFAAFAGPAVAQGTLPAAVPPPAEQAGADCARPQYASDTLVCGDPELRALDGEVAGLAKALPPLASSAYWEDQYGWMRRRARCAFEGDHRACLVAAYTDRRAVLIAATATASQPLRCDGPWRGFALLASAAAPLAIHADGRLISVATDPTRAWQPWVALRQDGQRITLRSQQGRSIRCRRR
jgi:uncharacterized protein